MANLWEQLPGEGPRAFDAFQKYIGLPRGTRSIDAACRAKGRSSPGRAPRRWFAWSTRYRWLARARAYDAHGDAIAQTAREERIRELAGERLDYEIAQLPSLLSEVERIRQALDVPLFITAGGKKRLNPLILDPGYGRLQKLYLVYGREIVNGPRKPDKGKPEELRQPPTLDRLSELPDAELDQLVSAARKLRELTTS